MAKGGQWQWVLAVQDSSGRCAQAPAHPRTALGCRQPRSPTQLHADTTAPGPKRAPSPSPCRSTADGTPPRSTLVQIAPAQVKTLQRSSSRARSSERRQHKGAALNYSQLPRPLQPHYTDPVPTVPTDPSQLCTLERLLFQRHLLF